MAQPCCAAPLDGATLSWAWVMPFVGLLVMIAIAPILTPRLWRRHYGKIAAGWSLCTVAAIAAKAGIRSRWRACAGIAASLSMGEPPSTRTDK